MYFYQTSISFQAIDRSDGPTSYLDGCIGDRYSATINGYFQKGSTNGQSTPSVTNLQFQSGVITALGNGELAATENFINDGFQVGETVRIPNSVLNSGTTFTITGITATTLTVTGTMIEETCSSFVYVSNIVNAMDFLYNLVPNGTTTPSFQSNTDNSIQKYSIASIPGTFIIGTKSYGWVTDTLTGNVSQATITASAVTSDYKQPFTITHYFFITPLFLPNQQINFQNASSPGYFPLAYAYQVNCYYIAPPIVNASYTGVIQGNDAWLNANNAGTPPEFTINSISYTDSSLNPLTTLDFNKTNLVTIKIKSASGLFTSGKKLILWYCYCPLSTSDYQGTSTTLRQNFMNDRAIQTIGGGSVNGEFYGTNYSIFQAVIATLVDSHNCTITCSCIYAASLIAFLNGKGTNNRNYYLAVTVET